MPVRRHESLEGRLFIDAADLDGDGDRDIVTGGWWYPNPGNGAAPVTPAVELRTAEGPAHDPRPLRRVRRCRSRDVRPMAVARGPASRRRLRLGALE
ncbi:MAG: hypothetical protein ACOC7R_04575 [Planctomycetota bacterium]